MVIDVDPDQFPLGIFIGLARQGPQGGTLQRLEELWRDPGSFLKGRALSVARSARNRGVQLRE